jgi:hypothetical protein
MSVKIAVAQKINVPPSWQTIVNSRDLDRFKIPRPGCFSDFPDHGPLQGSFLHGGQDLPNGGHALLHIRCSGGPVKIQRSWWRPATLPVPVYYSDRIRDIKERIERIQSIPAAKQHLFFDDRELNDAVVLDDLRPPEWLAHYPTYFRLAVADPIEIRIQPLTGDIFSVEVSLDDSIGEIKAKMTRHEQHLFFGLRELLDHDTLRDWSIDANCVLNLATPASTTEWQAKCAASVADAADQLIHVHIHNLVSNVFRSLTVRRTDLIRDIVSGLGWFDPEALVAGQDPGLWLSGLRLNPDSTFGANAIRQGMTLHFEIEVPQQFFVKTMTGRHFTLYMPFSDSIEAVRRSVKYVEPIRCYQQRLIWASQQWEDGCILRDYRVKKDMTVTMLIRAA